MTTVIKQWLAMPLLWLLFGLEYIGIKWATKMFERVDYWAYPPGLRL